MTKPYKVYHTPVEATLEVIGGKWKPVILFHLANGRKRNGQLMALMPSISQKVLTQQLRELEKDGIIARISYNEVPPKVEYELTEYGSSLKEILHVMCKWGEAHIYKLFGTNVELMYGTDESDNEDDV